MNILDIVRTLSVLVGLVMMVGCNSGATPSGVPATEVYTITTREVTSPTSSVNLETPEVRSLAPRSVKFQSLDGTQLAGLYWPPVTPSAPAVVLMHMMGGSKTDWGQFASLLQGAGIAQYQLSQQVAIRFAVLAIDMRGHGDSGGTRNDANGMIGDAHAALNFVRTLPGVDNTRIIMIGASIGGDAAVDACAEGCIGAVSLSPGSFLGVSYTDALIALRGKPVLCVASREDQPSAKTCSQASTLGLDEFQVQIYDGSAHGTNMFGIQDQKPFLTDLIFAWLRTHVG